MSALGVVWLVCLILKPRQTIGLTGVAILLAAIVGMAIAGMSHA